MFFLLLRWNCNCKNCEAPTMKSIVRQRSNRSIFISRKWFYLSPSEPNQVRVYLAQSKENGERDSRDLQTRPIIKLDTRICTAFHLVHGRIRVPNDTWKLLEIECQQAGLVHQNKSTYSVPKRVPVTVISLSKLKNRNELFVPLYHLISGRDEISSHLQYPGHQPKRGFTGYPWRGKRNYIWKSD